MKVYFIGNSFNFYDRPSNDLHQHYRGMIGYFWVGGMDRYCRSIMVSTETTHTIIRNALRSNQHLNIIVYNGYGFRLEDVKLLKVKRRL